MFERRKFSNPWEGYMKPFRMVGNVYFVGTFQASSHLIDTGDGLILIDTGYENTLYMVVDSIHRLGFDPMDIKYIINTHWHKDHTAGTALLAGITGAKTLIGRKDREKALEFFTPDILIDDGDTLALGNTTISFMETPGHTEGTISFFFDVTEADKTYRVGSFGGAGANTLVPGRLYYEGCREDYRASVHHLKQEKVDVFLGNHVWNNNAYEYGKLLLQTGENRFMDSTLWGKFLDFCETRLDQIIAEEK